MSAFPKFGSEIPYAEPAWYRGKSSPYYTEKHVELRARYRKFVNERIMPYWKEWDEQGGFPLSLHKEAYEAGVYSNRYPVELGGRGEDDAISALIIGDELSRIPAGGIIASLNCHGISVPAMVAVGSDYIKQKYASPAIRAEIVAALAITEPWVGSDVANLRTTAVLTADGKHYLVNGTKKFITGVRDKGGLPTVFNTAVRTGGEGRWGISLLVIEQSYPGVTVRRLKTQGWWASHTALINFEDVLVPVENLCGAENQGFLAIMMNFNGERFALCVGANRNARVCLEEASKNVLPQEVSLSQFKYARDRETFGKKLIKHDIIRAKIADMIRRVEANHAWLEQIAFNMNNGDDPQSLGSSLSLCKVACTEAMEFCAKEASQILGGASYLRQGRGDAVESIYRDVRVNNIGGGSAEIMKTLGLRLAKL